MRTIWFKYILDDICSQKRFIFLSNTPKLCSQFPSPSAVNLNSSHCASQYSSGNVLCGTHVGICEGLGAKGNSSFEYFSFSIVYCTYIIFLININILISFVIYKEVYSYHTSMRKILMSDQGNEVERISAIQR